MQKQITNCRKKRSQPVSRVLSWTVIHLGLASPLASSNLPASDTGRTNGGLFGLAPSGVYHATNCYQSRGALLPHPFTLTGCPHPSPLPEREGIMRKLRRSTLCCTFRRLAPPRRYLALCPMEPGLSSPMHQTTLKRVFQLTPERLSGRLRGGTLLVDIGKCKLRICSLLVFLRTRSLKVSALFPLWSKARH